MTVLPVDVDVDGPGAPPRDNGELVFEAPWQGRAFGACVALLQSTGQTWDDFRTYLVAAIEADPAASYYEAFVSALERFAAATCQTRR